MLELVSHDTDTEHATFHYGAMTITAQVPWGTGTVLEVAVAVGDQRSRGSFDLAVEEKIARFASVAACRLKLPAADISAALALVLPAVQRLAHQQSAPAPSTTSSTPSSPAEVMSAAEREEAMALLRDEHLMDRFASYLVVLGWSGDAIAKALVILSAISRLTDDPVWVAMTAANGSERFPGLAAVVAATPPEHLVHVTRLTDNALANADPDALRHKLLALDDPHAVSAPVATAIKVLHTQGYITGTRVERTGVRGQMRTRFVATHGPLAVVTAATGSIPETLRHHLLDVPVDESAEQARHRLAARCQRLASPPTNAEAVARRLQNAQRLLQPLPVVVPEAEHIALPPAIAANRLMQDALFGLIAASAILHQHQRPRIDGAVVATGRDIALASRLVGMLAASAATGLSRSAQRLLAAMNDAGRSTFTMTDLAAMSHGLCRWSIRLALDDLVASEFVVASRGGQRGVPRTYDLVGNLAPRELAGLASVGFCGQANFTSEVANG